MAIAHLGVALSPLLACDLISLICGSHAGPELIRLRVNSFVANHDTFAGVWVRVSLCVDLRMFTHWVECADAVLF